MDVQSVSEIAGVYIRRAVLFSAGVLFVVVVLSLAGALAFGFVVGLLVFLAGGGYSFLNFVAGYSRGQWMLSESVLVLLDSVSVQQNPSIDVRGSSNTVTVQSAGIQRQEIVRLVPVHTPNRVVDGVDEGDLRAFVEGIFIRGFSQRAWMGQQLPSGRRVESFQDYDGLIKPVVAAGAIVDRRERSAGRLVVSSADELKQRLGL